MRRNHRFKLICALCAAAALLAAVAFFWRAHTAPLRPRAQKTGVTVLQNEHAELDLSNLSEGYLLLRYTGGKETRIRADIAKLSDNEPEEHYYYELTRGGAPETLPLTEGDGEYRVTVYENTEADRYLPVFQEVVTLKLRDPLLPFLYPNQYVWFSPDSHIVDISMRLTASKNTDFDRFYALYEQIVAHFDYDYARSEDVAYGYLPDVDVVWAAQSGICFDYCAVLAAMCRNLAIPCRLAVGDVLGTPHSWVEVWLDGAWVRFDPTFASTGERSDETMAFIADDANYIAERYY